MLWSFEKSAIFHTIKQELSTSKIYEHNRLCRFLVQSFDAFFASKGYYFKNIFDEKSIVDRHRCHAAAKFGVFVDEDHSKLPTLYWLP